MGIQPTVGLSTGSLRWATTFHHYLEKAHVSAIVWWAGAQPTGNNESLIVLNKTTGEFVLPKRYDTFGNYTRYIPTGSHRIKSESSGMPEGVKVTSFIKDGRYTVVVVNPTDKKIDCLLSLEDARSKEPLSSYTTTMDKRWEESTITCSKDGYALQVLPRSVTTYVGVCYFDQ